MNCHDLARPLPLISIITVFFNFIGIQQMKMWVPLQKKILYVLFQLIKKLAVAKEIVSKS